MANIEGKITEASTEGRSVVDSLKNVLGRKKEYLTIDQGVLTEASRQKYESQRGDYKQSFADAMTKYASYRESVIDIVEETKKTADIIGIKLSGMQEYTLWEKFLIKTVIFSKLAKKGPAERIRNSGLPKLIDTYMSQGKSIQNFLTDSLEDLTKMYQTQDINVNELGKVQESSVQLVEKKGIELKESQTRLTDLTKQFEAATGALRFSLETKIAEERENAKNIEDSILIESTRAKYARDEQDISFTVKQQVKHQYRLTKIIVEQIGMVEKYSQPTLQTISKLLAQGGANLMGKQYIDNSGILENTGVRATTAMQKAQTDAILDTMTKDRAVKEILEAADAQTKADEAALKDAAIRAIEILKLTKSMNESELDAFMREQEAIGKFAEAKDELDAPFKQQ